jgi:hypothetical protein
MRLVAPLDLVFLATLLRLQVCQARSYLLEINQWNGRLLSQARRKPSTRHHL